MARHVVDVTYRFAVHDARCRPAVLSIALDVNDDGYPPYALRYPVSRTGFRRIVVPPILGVPDVLSVSAVTAPGVPNRAVSVLIRR